MKKIAIYARVSTRHHGQNPETQLLALRDYAKARGLEITMEYVECGISGGKEWRPQLDRLMGDARRRKFDAVLVARFDRFARSTRHLLNALEEFRVLGVDFVSLKEAVDTSNPYGRMLFTILANVAELERDIIKERIALGLLRARKEGRTLGRPKRIFNHDQAIRLREEGNSIRAIATLLGVGKDTVHALLNDRKSPRLAKPATKARTARTT
jgi:DNA invertase Pin-like site-specific DNA recombinase